MNKKPFISICIPTYNRKEKVYKLVNDILNYKGDEIEVVVLDNCSTDATKLLLKKIDDYRFHYFLNDINIGSILNILKVLTKANGQYSILCLDKDYLDYQEIPNLVNHLKYDNDVVFGYCSLNLQNISSDKVFEKGYSSVLNMAYLSKHPSGYFYKTDMFINSKILKQIFTQNDKFGFPFELINAEMSFSGKSKVINLPLFNTESRNDCAKIPSFTFDKSNIYFDPKERFIECVKYIMSVLQLDLLKKEKRKLIILLFSRGLIASTFGYRTILADHPLCLHHGIEPHKISIIELIKIDFEFSSSFFRENLSISHFRKLTIIFLTHLRGIIIILKNKFSMNSN